MTNSNIKAIKLKMKSSKLQSKTQDWEVKKLREVVVDLLNGFPSRPVPEDEGIPQFHPHNIGLDGSLIFEGVKFVPSKIRNIEKYFLKKDDVIFNNTNSIEQVGKTTYVDKDYKIVFSNHLTRIRTNQTKVKGYFLAILLQYLYKRKRFQSLCTPWVNQAAVQNSTLKNLKIPVPPLEIQRKIVERLDAIRKAQELNNKQIDLAEELFQSLLHRELDPIGKNWELKMIKEMVIPQELVL
ncbi:MAG: restriction endonuclease subunit S [Actinomycetota bacterium]|nr:restriction endonuclease subunit S [Actinomycetota bacterium]